MSQNRSLSKFLWTFFFLLLFSGHAALAQNGGEKKDQKKETKTEAVKKTEVIKTPVRGRAPVIIIPGLIGSELVNKNTNKKAWFDLGRVPDDDLRLPISPDLKANRDNLEPSDILRKIQLIRLTPEIDIYQKLIDILREDGFAEGKIDEPIAGGDADTVYTFAYDWRLDNVENAQRLLRKMDDLRVELKRPDLKFNVVAHSMGGLIARYAALYGKADLTPGRARPTWRGASYFNSLSMVATPDDGALSALDSLINGFSLFGSGKINLPFIQNLTKFDLFTIPSIYQLLPHDGSGRVFDENLRPLTIDLYNPATWEKYGWAVYNDEEFAKKFEPSEQAQAKAYFRAVLRRARLFHVALDARPARQSPISTYYLGSECKPTIDGMIIRRDAKKNIWKTDFGISSYEKSDGTKVTEKETEKVLLSPGDGVVPKRSLVAWFTKLGRLRGLNSDILINDSTASCDDHNRLTSNAVVEKNLLSVLNNRLPKGNDTAKVGQGENR